MSILALATAGALLVATSGTLPADVVIARPGGPNLKTTDATWFAAHGGFLLGNAQRCGVAAKRVVRAGRLVQALIGAAAQDDQESEDATTRFAQFFMATTVPGLNDTKLVASCKLVVGEFEKLERHQIGGKDVSAVIDSLPSPRFRLSDGE